MFFKIFVGLIVGVFLSASWVVSNPPIKTESMVSLGTSLVLQAK